MADVVTLELDRIVVGRRLRSIDADWVALIAASMKERGQDTPIHVGPAGEDGRHPLIAGAHRVAALREAGLPEARCIIFRGDALAAQLLEIDENLLRRGLSALDRAVFLAKRKAIYEEMYPETRHGGARNGSSRHGGDLIAPDRFTKGTAEKLGLGERTIQRAIRYAQIPEWARELIAPTHWADRPIELDALARIEDEGDLREVVTALTRAEAPAASVAAALAELGLRDAPDRRGEALNRLITAWRKATAKADRRAFLQHILADEPTLDLVNELLEDAEYGTADNQTRVLRAVGKRGGR
jgi:ParB family transcriptional regulator, chromosome partitioning protein